MPEETNRVLTDHVSKLLFCSSDVGKQNLAKEGIVDGVHVVGDVMADANLLAQKIVRDNTSYRKRAVPKALRDTHFSLLTLHHAENTDNSKRLSSIVDALNALCGAGKSLETLIDKVDVPHERTGAYGDGRASDTISQLLIEATV